MSKATTNSTTDGEKGTVPTTSKRADQAPDGRIIGIDNDGNRHWQSYQLKNVVTVIAPDGTVIHSQFLGHNGLRRWKRYVVETKSGWAEWRINSASPLLSAARDLGADISNGGGR